MSVPQRNSIAAIKKTGEMMLQGWKLLATLCPICNTALLSKGDQMRCPACDLPVMIEGDSRIGNAKAAPALPTQYELSDDEEDEDHEHDFYAEEDEVNVPSSLEDLKRDYDAKNKQRNAVSARLGEKMLQGYIMLGQTCPLAECAGTPLMQQGKGAHMLCVSCNREYTSRNGDVVPVQTEAEAAPKAQPSSAVKVHNTSKLEEMLSALDDEIAAAPQQQKGEAEGETDLDRQYGGGGFDFDSIPILGWKAFAVDPEDSSHKIGQRLMQGWALLDEVCPTQSCRTPLMRNLDGHKVCVACEYSSGPPKAAVAKTSAAAPAVKPVAPARGAKKDIRVESDSEESRDLNALYEADTDPSDDEELLQEGGGAVGDYLKQWRAKVDARLEANSPRRQRELAVAAAEAASIASAQAAGAAGHRRAPAAALEGPFGRVLDILNKKLLRTAEALEMSESIDRSTKLADLVYKLTAAIQQIEGSASERRRETRRGVTNEDDHF